MAFQKPKLDDLLNAAKKDTTKKTNDFGNDRFWTLGRNETDIGYAEIRFLPTPDGIPWAHVFSYFFQGKNGWYVENSRQSIEESDPVLDYYKGLWNSKNSEFKAIESEKERKAARKDFGHSIKKYKAHEHFITNILVVRDDINPENEGKVFLYKLTPSLFGMLHKAMKPDFPDEQAIHPFSVDEDGATFKLKINKANNDFFTYEKSSFKEPAPLTAEGHIIRGEVETIKNFTTDEVKSFVDSVFDLNEFIDDIKSYDELKAKFIKVTGISEAEFNSIAGGGADKPETAAAATQTAGSASSVSDDKIDEMLDGLDMD